MARDNLGDTLKKSPYKANSMARLLLTLVVCCLCGCASSSSARRPEGLTTTITDVGTLTPVLKEHLPPGTTAEEAQQFMNREGFTCRRESQGTFRYKVVAQDGSTKKHELELSDHLRCRRDMPNGWVTTVVFVAIVLEDEQVKDIVVDRDFVGP